MNRIAEADMEMFRSRGDVFFTFASSPEPPVYSDKVFRPENGGTPRGVYVYPVEAWDTPQVIYGKGRRYIHVLRSLVPELRLDRVSNAAVAADLQRMRERLGGELMDKIRAKYEQLQEDYELRFNIPGELLHYAVTRVGDPEGRVPKQPSVIADAITANRVYAALGHRLVGDRIGIIYASEPVQAFFTDSEAYEPIALVDRGS